MGSTRPNPTHAHPYNRLGWVGLIGTDNIKNKLKNSSQERVKHIYKY